MNIESAHHLADSIITLLLESKVKIYLGLAGLGSGVLQALLQRPGISDLFLGATLCYHEQSLRNFCGKPKGVGAVSAPCVARLARQAYVEGQSYLLEDVQRGRRDREDLAFFLGVGATAAFQTNRTRKGKDRIHIAIRDLQNLSHCYVECSGEDRSSQLLLGDLCILRVVIGFLQVHYGVVPPWQEFIANSPDHVKRAFSLLGDCKLEQPITTSAQLLFDKRAFPFVVHPDGSAEKIDSQIYKDKIFFAGSFNPDHVGHHWMAERIGNQTSKEVLFELSIANVEVEKDNLGWISLKNRLERLFGQTVIVSNFPLFLDKARYFKCSFLLGEDTGVRLFDEAYLPSGYSLEQLAHELRALGTHFYFVRRKKGESPLSQLIIPESFVDLITLSPSTWGISSSMLRSLSKNQQFRKLEGRP